MPHDTPLGDGQWWACDHPERPHEQLHTVYRTKPEDPCRACAIALVAAIDRGDFGEPFGVESMVRYRITMVREHSMRVITGTHQPEGATP